jgi:putative oxidoreductase
MNIVLWIVQILLAIAFFAHGLLLLFPPAEIAKLMDASLPRWFQLFLGWAEILAALGLTLPAVTRIQPWLVVWAAVGIMIVMVSATYYHIVRGESAVATLILLAMAGFVAYMRYRVVPIAPRTRAVHDIRV